MSMKPLKEILRNYEYTFTFTVASTCTWTAIIHCTLPTRLKVYNLTEDVSVSQYAVCIIPNPACMMSYNTLTSGQLLTEHRRVLYKQECMDSLLGLMLLRYKL